MARGWESKSVEQQQAEMSEQRKTHRAPISPNDQQRNRKRDGLLLSRRHLTQQLLAAGNPRRRQMPSWTVNCRLLNKLRTHRHKSEWSRPIPPITKTSVPLAAPRRIIDRLMKAYVYVSLKKSVLDPQGKTIHGALTKIGYKSLQEVRQGKYFEITLNGGISKDEAQAEVERIAREVLTNPVIEEFR